MQPYQVERIMNTFGVDYLPDAQTAELSKEEKLEMAKQKKTKKAAENYNVKQSKIAIGSGGMWGKGFLKGTRPKVILSRNSIRILFLLPWARILDSGEAPGNYSLCTIHVADGISSPKDREVFSRVYAYSVAAIMFFHVTINICMTVGLAPVIGITLPLMSYGGSSLLTFTILIFIMVRLDADRHMVLR